MNFKALLQEKVNQKKILKKNISQKVCLVIDFFPQLEYFIWHSYVFVNLRNIVPCFSD